MATLYEVFLTLLLSIGLLDIVGGQMYSPGAISQIDKVSGQYIMLTFDDGPHATLTPKLLDILKEKSAKATFYVMGYVCDFLRCSLSYLSSCLCLSVCLSVYIISHHHITLYFLSLLLLSPSLWTG